MSVEIERKYLIEIPDISVLERISGVKKYMITQTYLESGNDVERRVRKRVCEEKNEYFYTEKSFLTHTSRREEEREISEAEYTELLKDKREDYEPLFKTRYVIPWKKHLIEIDIYSFSNSLAIAETELSDEREKVEIPSFIEIIKEVTGIKEYSNAYIAKTHILEK